jgi:Ca2+-binding RTX toxin-like protein
MRSLLGGLAAATCLLLCMPVTGAAALASAPVSPSCASGPVTVGDTTFGTPCDDVIVAPAGVETVRGGGGDDMILAAPIAASAPCLSACFLGVGSQTFEGGPGDDIVFGQRGNDTLLGGEDNDQLFGGIGDDLLRGGPGNDLLAGGFGADFIDGEGGDDYVHGDGTIDRIYDSGGGTDTLSFATGITPGFGGEAVAKGGYENLLPQSVDRGVFLDLSAIPTPENGNGNNGVPPLGGGVDDVEGGSFETVIGTAFSDHIVGTTSTQTIYGGGGADVLDAGAGTATLNGGADGDNVDAGGIDPPEPNEVSIGFMTPGEGAYAQLYATGSEGNDAITATYSPGAVTFTLGGPATFASPTAGCVSTSNQMICSLTAPLAAPLDSIVLAGMDGDDTLSANGFPSTTTVIELGGEGSDSLNGGDASEDVLVDGPEGGVDVLNAYAGDDALLHNGGADRLYGGEGNDLFLSNSVCDGNLLSGGNGRDNASWARLKEGVGANLASHQAGRPGVGGTPSCSGGLDSLWEIEDLEGGNSRDILYGDSGPNQLLGHEGPDDYSAGPGADTILANSGSPKLLDSDPLVDCGDDIDRALIDFPQYGLDVPVNCEAVVEAAPNSFQLLPNFPLPTPPPPAVVPRPIRDRTPPRTRIRSRPRAILTTRKARARAVFRFTANEGGASFRCKLDRKPYRPCVSPRVYMLAPGRHTVRIFAIDRAGNADRTPALLSLRVRRR